MQEQQVFGKRLKVLKHRGLVVVFAMGGVLYRFTIITIKNDF